MAIQQIYKLLYVCFCIVVWYGLHMLNAFYANQLFFQEAHLFGLPPMSDHDSKMAMLQMLAPNAMKAYKRKKLTMFPSSSANTTMEGQAEMEIDSGEGNLMG